MSGRFAWQENQVRYDRTRRNRYVVYFNKKRMGDALVLDVFYHANRRKPSLTSASVTP